MNSASPGIDVLNVGAGHLKFRFDKGDAEDTAKAKKVLTDMLKRGYLLFVKIDGEQKRVRAFDPATDEYILEEPDVIQEPEEKISPTAPRLADTGDKRRAGRPKGKRVPLKSVRATAIGPTAGG